MAVTTSSHIKHADPKRLKQEWEEFLQKQNLKTTHQREAIAQQIEAGDRRIGGLMLESHLVAGRQDLVAGRPLVYGQSITDGCIDWQTSVPVLERLAAAVGKRRRSRPHD